MPAPFVTKCVNWWTALGPPSGATVPEARFYNVVLVGTPVATLIHLLLLSLFAGLQVWPMVGFNVGSVLAWLGIAVACRAGALRFGLAFGVVEVIAHAVVATRMLGWEAGFHLYPLTVAVVLLASTDRAFAALQAVVQYGAWVALFLLTPHEYQPWSPVSAEITVALNAANHVVAFTVAGYILWQVTRLANSKEVELAASNAQSERLLHNILPVEIASRLKAGEDSIADGFPCATVLFSDLVGFTKFSAKVSPEELVAMLNDVFRRVDALAVRCGLEKIKTIGDAYMVASGIPAPRDDHAEAMTEFALLMLAAVAAVGEERGIDLQVRVGIHSGPVVAGVIGTSKFAYDLWGDTVNTAARMESHGVPGCVHVSSATAALLRERFVLEPRGSIEVKGKGAMETYLVRERHGS